MGGVDGHSGHSARGAGTAHRCARGVGPMGLGRLLHSGCAGVVCRDGVARRGAALRRLGIAFVERFDAAQGVEDTRALQARVHAGESMVFFPEGRLRRAGGLQPFKLGAFVIAADTATPLVPVTLKGTRSLLRDGAWLPRRCAIEVTIGEAIPAGGPGWDHALALRDAARKALAAHLAEATHDD